MAKAILVRFNPAQLFPPADALTAPLHRLMLAADDVRFASMLVVETGQRLASASEGIQKRILTGQFWYALRLLCSHLNEAGDALRRLDGSMSRSDLDRLLSGRPQASEALSKLRALFESEERKESFIYRVRNWIGFHYQEQDIKRVYERGMDLGLVEGLVTASEVGGLARFVITDGLALLLMVEATGIDLAELSAGRGAIEGFAQRASGEVLPISEALTTFVDQLVDSLLQKRGHIGFEEGAIEIPLLLRAAKDTVEAERKRG